ncbi:MAG: hypothetical protein WC792_06490 [Candidatus Micrarchaeia archaeon]|jgi:hypothetical protein
MGALDSLKRIFLGAYSYANKKGVQYYLHAKVVATVETADGPRESKIYYFSRDSKDAISLPDGFQVVESQRTGLPVLKKLPGT